VYVVVAALAAHAGAAIVVTQDRTTITVRATGVRRETPVLTALMERTRAVGGSWRHEDETLEASYPCGS
jgi:hypothetical protein